MSTSTRTHSNFPLLADIERQVMLKLDQPSDEEGQLTWILPDEFLHAANQEYIHLWGRLSNMGYPFRPKVDTTTVSVVAGTRTYSLPADCRQLRRVIEINASGEELEEVRYATDADLDEGVQPSAIYRPDAQELYFTADPQRDFQVKLVYMPFPLPLAHGTARGGSISTLKLGQHETWDDGAFVGQPIYVYDGQGASQSATPTAYAGKSQTVTVTWTAIDNGSGALYPGAGSSYSTRPLLPPGLQDAFIYGICSRMVEKLEDERYIAFQTRREVHLDRVKQDIGRRDLQGPIVTRDDSELSGIDPYWTGGYP
jgi:hypothetical protein